MLLTAISLCQDGGTLTYKSSFLLSLALLPAKCYKVSRYWDIASLVDVISMSLSISEIARVEWNRVKIDL